MRLIKYSEQKVIKQQFSATIHNFVNFKFEIHHDKLGIIKKDGHIYIICRLCSQLSVRMSQLPSSAGTPPVFLLYENIERNKNASHL